MPEPARTVGGWSGPARVLLIVVAGLVAVGLIRVGSGQRAEVLVPLPTLVLDANSAPGAVLETLPMIGPVLAGRIVAAREQAPFRSLDDFDRRVKGIGPVTVAALKPFLRFEIRADR